MVPMMVAAREALNQSHKIENPVVSSIQQRVNFLHSHFQAAIYKLETQENYTNVYLARIFYSNSLS